MLTSELDDVVASYERTWGIDRLPLIVSAETAARFRAAEALHRQEHELGCSQERSATLNAMMFRAWTALAKEAVARGHQPLGPSCFEAEWAPGRIFAIAVDAEHAQALNARNKAEGREVSVWTVAEVGALIGDVPLVRTVKEAWPGAEVRPLTRTPPLPEDEIPFGGDHYPSADAEQPPPAPAATGPEPWEAAGRAMHAAGLMSDSTAVALGLTAPGAAGKRRARA